MATEKRCHNAMIASSQKCRSAIKRMWMVLHLDLVELLGRRIEKWTTLFFEHVSPVRLATGAFTVWMSASTHLECYRGASRCVLIGGSQPIERNESLYGRKWDISVPRLYEVRKILYGTF